MTEVSAAPRPLKDKRQEQRDELLRPQAAVLYPALKAAGEGGLAWRECFVLVSEDTGVGRVVVWMRSHGVEISAWYEAGETRFRLG